MWAYGITKNTRNNLLRESISSKKPSLGIELMQVPIPNLKPNEVLIRPKCTALNFNSIWSSLLEPVDPFNLISSHVSRNPSDIDHDLEYAIFGSDAAGEIVAIGSYVTNWKVGDFVVVHCNVVDPMEPAAQADSITANSQSIWGYETNFGAFAEYTKVQQSQLLKKPKCLSWEASCSVMLSLSTAYRMLISENGAQIKAGDTVLIWGAAGGLGTFAIQLAKLAGATVVAIVSSETKAEVCRNLGADFIINREIENFKNLTNLDGSPNYISWKKAKKVLHKLNIGEIDVVFEHVGRETLGFSIYLAKRGGKIVTCAASSGFVATIDLRYIWMQVKSLIGSHFANYAEAESALKLVENGLIKPVIHSVNPINELPTKMDEMYAGKTFGKIIFTHH